MRRTASSDMRGTSAVHTCREALLDLDSAAARGKTEHAHFLRSCNDDERCHSVTPPQSLFPSVPGRFRLCRGHRGRRVLRQKRGHFQVIVLCTEWKRALVRVCACVCARRSICYANHKSFVTAFVQARLCSQRRDILSFSFPSLSRINEPVFEKCRHTEN